MAIESMVSQERQNQWHNGSSLVETGSPDGGAALAALAVGAFVVAVISFALMFIVIIAGWAICSVLAAPEYAIRYTFANMSPTRFGTTEVAKATYRMRVMQCSCVMNWIAAIAGFVGIVALVIMAAAAEAEVAFDFSLGAPTAGDWFFLGMADWNSPGIAFDPSPPTFRNSQEGRRYADHEKEAFDFLMSWVANHRTSPRCDPGCPNSEDAITYDSFAGPVVRSASTDTEPAEQRILTLDGNEPRCYEIEPLAQWLKLQKIDPLSRKRLTLGMVRELIETPKGAPAGGCVPQP
jgi:hypothetical protein